MAVAISIFFQGQSLGFFRRLKIELHQLYMALLVPDNFLLCCCHW